MPGPRFVQVAVDAAGVAGGKTYTYHLPDRLLDVSAGEAVLVEYGRRPALAIVLGDASAPAVATKPVLERVRSDGPLLAPLQLELARHVAEHYLAPPAMVIRAMLPPGLLERLELVARAGAAGTPATTASPPVPGGDLVGRIRAAGEAGVPVAALGPAAERTALLRELRALERRGLVHLEWRVGQPRGRPREERRARLTDEGRAAAAALAGGASLDGRRLGPRQRELLAALAAQPAGAAVPVARLGTRFTAGAVSGLARRGFVALERHVLERRPLAGRAPTTRPSRPAGAGLTTDQAEAAERVCAAVAEHRFRPFLLEGVTAAGKSAVYAVAIEAALASGRGALVLVPEIALAVPLLDRLEAELGLDVALLHSGLSEGERADEWRRIRAGEARVVVGTRLAVLAPLRAPGLVVVDEEHDAGYKSDRTPRFHARDTALVLGRLAGAPVVLGSATPDVATVGRARAGGLEHLRLTERLAGRRARVEVVDLRAELEAGNKGLLSSALRGALGRLDTASGERAILVINRRGSASVVLCRDCGYVQICPECRRPLVFHAAGVVLRCHHCGASAPLARRCPACSSPRIRYLGGGTERVEREVRETFPRLRVERLDRDVVERKGAAERVIDGFTEGAVDVLVGTSLVTKGLDVPEVTLVGVVSADIALSLPDERAAERTYQLLVQAIGRAGRGEREALAVVQTYLPHHPVIRAVADDDAVSFYEAELEARRRFRSPPFGSLVKLTVALEDREKAEAEGERLAAELRERARRAPGETVVLGPAPAYVARRAGRWRFHVILRGDDPLGVLGGDPGARWSVDVDPESLL